MSDKILTQGTNCSVDKSKTTVTFKAPPRQQRFHHHKWEAWVSHLASAVGEKVVKEGIFKWNIKVSETNSDKQQKGVFSKMLQNSKVPISEVVLIFLKTLLFFSSESA